MIAPNSDTVVRFLRRFRERLTNFSRRNRELYYKPSALSLSLSVDPFSELLSDERAKVELGHFEGITGESAVLQALLNSSELDLSSFFRLNAHPPQDLFEVFDQKRAQLLSVLERIRLEDQRFQKEYGISGAWMLGPFLCWRTARQYGEADIAITPVFRVPVNILVNKARTWKLELETQELLINPSLRLFLRNSWGIELPERCDDDNFAAALTSVVEIITKAGKTLQRSAFPAVPRLLPRQRPVYDDDGQVVGREPVDIHKELRADELELYRQTTSDHFVLVDVFQISHISASKMALVEDYDRIIESPDEHPIISELIQGNPVKDDAKSSSSPRQLDSYKESLNHFVVEIDSTQHRAVDRSSKGSAIVIQGPPGTGKSQTITNLIAENVASGKKVLFVSEKRAALDVVYSRLKKANIADQSVLLHSSDLNKSELYQSFLSLVDQRPSGTVSKEWSAISSDLDGVKAELHEFREVFAEVHEESGLPVSEVLCRFGELGASKPNLNAREKIGSLDAVTLGRLEGGLTELQSLVRKLSQFIDHPWLNRKSEVTGSLTLRSQLEDWHCSMLESCRALRKAEQRISELAPGLQNSVTGIVNPELPKISDIKAMEKQLQSVFLKLSSLRQEDNARLAALRDLVSVLRDNQGAYVAFDSTATAEDVASLWSYFRVERGLFERFGREYRRARQLGRSVLKDKTQFRSKALYKGFLDYQEGFGAVTETLMRLSYPRVLRISDVEATISCVSNIDKMCEQLDELNQLWAAVSGGEDSKVWSSWSEVEEFLTNHSELLECLENRGRALSAINQTRMRVNELFVSAPTWEGAVSNSALVTERLRNAVDDLDALDAIFAQMRGLQRLCVQVRVEELVLSILAHEVSGDWAEYVAQQVVGKWYDDVRKKHALLRQFDGTLFEKRAAQFKALESRHRDQAQGVVRNKWAETWSQQDRSSQGVRLLAKEAGKKRKVKTPREVMEAGALEAMLALKPVWLMSPLSISQMLPLQKEIFDLIVFDEASQVRVEDAIPSIYRASRLVVVGDRQQMPPTNFFDSGLVVEDDEDDVEDIPESILDLALQVYPDVLLEWHYRSKNEALIAFSNRAFYGGRLIAPPNPQLLTQGQPIEFHQLSDAYFSTRSGNQIEAEAVVDRVEQLIRENPARSIGILALGQSQMRAIDQVIEQRMKDSVFRQLIEDASNLKDGEADVGFFVKNLENVQGDERDVIVMSVGYAPARQGRKLYKNFGPLSKKGGGRRLNVAVTRAKSKVVVFCSFSPDEIDTDEAAFAHNPDTVYFGRYLKYARAVSANDLESTHRVLNSFPMAGVLSSRKPTRFNLDVKRRLEELGYRVSTEIGSCGYFVDLGVHHPIDERRFILGIECDGALFHSTPYARDRDKVREELLRARGWEIARIWSTDWSKDWRSEVRRIHELLRDRMNAAKQVSVVSEDLGT
ncbi:MAG: AAA domain-containing protein [Pseudomonadota bacterium]|jgi:very-short-patch-repair endonuclease